MRTFKFKLDESNTVEINVDDYLFGILREYCILFSIVENTDDEEQILKWAYLEYIQANMQERNFEDFIKDLKRNLRVWKL